MCTLINLVDVCGNRMSRQGQSRRPSSQCAGCLPEEGTRDDEAQLDDQQTSRMHETMLHASCYTSCYISNICYTCPDEWSSWTICLAPTESKGTISRSRSPRGSPRQTRQTASSGLGSFRACHHLEFVADKNISFHLPKTMFFCWGKPGF